MKKGNKETLRGTVFESVVKHLAQACGYLDVQPGAEGDLQVYRLGNLPMVHGLGEGHNADVLLEPPLRMALAPRQRLLIECKGYQKPVGLDVLREAVGLRLDINSFRQLRDDELERRALIRRPSRTITSFPYYSVAVASLCGFSVPAQCFASTHHIALLDYKGLPLLNALPELIGMLDPDDFAVSVDDKDGFDADDDQRTQNSLPEAIRGILGRALAEPQSALHRMLSAAGIAVLGNSLEALAEIVRIGRMVRYAYMALLGDEIHVHMLSRNPVALSGSIPGADLAFEIKYTSPNRGHWHLVSLGTAGDEAVELEFALPQVLLERWAASGFSRDTARYLKSEHFERVEFVGPVRNGPSETIVRHFVGVVAKKLVREAQDQANRGRLK